VRCPSQITFTLSIRSSASALPPSRTAFFPHLQPQHSPVFHPNLQLILSRFDFIIGAHRWDGLSFVRSQVKPSASMLLTATNYAVRFLPLRGVSVAVYGLYLLHSKFSQTSKVQDRQLLPQNMIYAPSTSQPPSNQC